MMALFPTVSAAVETVSEITRHKIIPTALELMDRLCIDCVRSEPGMSLPPQCGALLLIEVDGDKALAKREAERIREISLQTGAMEFLAASGKREAEKLWEARRNVSTALYKLKPDKVSEDVVVPRSRMAELSSFLDALGRKYNLPIAAYGHAGDGNIHVNVLFDKNAPKETQKVDVVVRELFRKVLETKGTISGEHGIGLTKAPYLDMEMSRPAIKLMARIKLAFDPKGILNPGKIFPYRS
jgi:glycolate oxidase